jgi:hypothetical protein
MNVLLLAVALCQDDVEAILSKTRAKFEAAKTIRITGEMRMAGEGPLKFELAVKGGNRYRLHIKGDVHGESMETTGIGDGRRVVTDGSMPPEFLGTKPETFPAAIRGGRLGTSLVAHMLTQGRDARPEKVELKSREKVGKRDAYVFEYSLAAGGEDAAGKSWIDVETLLPIKHQLSMHGMTFEEEFTELDIDGPVDDALFTTVTKPGVTKALARQLASAVALYQAYTGVRPRDLAALAAKGDVDAFWPDGGYALVVPKDAWGRAFAFDGASVTSLGADGKPGGKGDDEDVSVPVPAPTGQPIRPPTERLVAHYTARVHVRLVADAVRAYREAYREAPSSLADLTTKPAWADVWPEGGFARAVPKDCACEGSRVRAVGVERVKPESLTPDEKAKLEEAGRLRLADADRARAVVLIAKLGDDDLESRSAAAADLERMGCAVRPLVEAAIAGDKNPDRLARLKDVLSKIPEPVPAWRAELGSLVAKIGTGRPRSAGNDASCSNNLKQLWTMQANYMAQFGGRAKLMPQVTGPDFWLALSRTKPPLIDESLKDIFVCPGSGEEDGCTYWGPASDVNTYADGDPVGMCDDPSHGGKAVILRKSGDVMLYGRDDALYKEALKKLKGPEE